MRRGQHKFDEQEYLRELQVQAAEQKRRKEVRYGARLAPRSALHFRAQRTPRAASARRRARDARMAWAVVGEGPGARVERGAHNAARALA